MSTSQKPEVYVIGTGGTIAGQGSHRLDFTEYGYTGGPLLTIQEMLERIPEAEEIARVKAEQLINVGSNRLELQHWLEMARRINGIFRQEPEVAGAVVTHGTATIEETAYFLNLTVKSRKPVVVTGSMRPTTAIGTDAQLNLLDAIRVAASPESAGKGVLTVLNNEIQAARHVTKSNTYRLETFRSGELGFLGYADSDQRVVFYQTPTRRHTHDSEFDVEGLAALPRVDIVYSYATGDGLLVRALVEAGVAGIVAAGYGSGSGSPDFQDALGEARWKGITVVMSSHVGNGRVIPTSNTDNQGIVAGDDLSPKKARILLMLALASTKDPNEIQRMFYEY